MKKLFTHSDCTVTGPVSESARVNGEISRCWANFIAVYGHEPTHCFLGPREWDHFLLWVDELDLKEFATVTKNSTEKKFKGMHMYRTERPGVACAICFTEPMLDSEPARYVGEKTEGVTIGEDTAASGLPQ